MKSIELTNTEASFLQDGIAAAKSGDKALARSLLLEAIEHDSNNEIGWLWLAYVADNLPEAIEYLRRVLAINPQNDQARANLNKVLLRHGVALAKEGDKSQARALLLEASFLNPDNELVWLWLASVAENSDDALACLRRTIEINPANEQATSWMNKLRSQPATQKADRRCLDCGAVLPEKADGCPTCRTALTPAVAEQTTAEAAEATVAEAHAEEVTELKEQAEVERAKAEAVQAVVAEAHAEEVAELKEQTEAEQARAEDEVRVSEEAERKGAGGEARMREAEAPPQEEEAEANHIVKAGDEAERRREYADSLARRFNRIMNTKGETEMARAEIRTREAEARPQETEAGWREEARAEAVSQEEAKARAIAGQLEIETGGPITEAHAKEVAELKARIKAEQVKAEPAVRASEEVRRARAEAEASLREAEARFREIEDSLKEKTEARAMAEQRVKDAQEEFKRIVNARREAEMAWAEAEAEVRKEAKARASAEQARADAEAQVVDAISASEEAESRRAEAEAGLLEFIARLQEAEAKWRKDTGAQDKVPAAEAPAAEPHVNEAAEPEAQARVVQTISRIKQPLWEEDRSPAEQVVQKMGGEIGAALGHTLALHVEADHVDFKAKAKLVSYCLIVILLVTFVWLVTNYY